MPWWPDCGTRCSRDTFGIRPLWATAMAMVRCDEIEASGGPVALEGTGHRVRSAISHQVKAVLVDMGVKYIRNSA
jgi:hypothetical protein